MAKTYTTEQVSRFSKRSRSVISKLVKSGKLAGRKQGRTYVFDCESREQLVEAIHALVPKGGYRKQVKPKAKTVGLNQLIEFANFPEKNRDLLLKIGEKFDENSLEILLSL